MIDPERLAAFALMTAVTSVVPGVSMLFLISETLRAGWRSGVTALVGMQMGYLVWWALAALGLGTLAAAFPLTFRALAIGGALYIAWLGVQSIREAGKSADPNQGTSAPSERSHRAFHQGVLIALGNPKALIYIVALLPPFVDQREAVVPQLVVLAVTATAIDLVVGATYIAAGAQMAQAMVRPTIRHRIDIAIGVIFLVIASGVLIDTLGR